MKKVVCMEDIEAKAIITGKLTQGWVPVSTLSYKQTQKIATRLRARELAGLKNNIIKVRAYKRADGIPAVYLGELA